MTSEPRIPPAVDGRLSHLEQALIEEFLHARGYDPLQVAQLPSDVRNPLLKEASIYASGKLAEVESRSHFVDEIHDAGSGLLNTGLE